MKRAKVVPAPPSSSSTTPRRQPAGGFLSMEPETDTEAAEQWALVNTPLATEWSGRAR